MSSGPLSQFRRATVASPDLVERFRDGLPIAELDPASLYNGGAAGNVDYGATGTRANGE